MAEGDFLEPVFEFTVRTFFPRYGGNEVLEVVSWPWLGVLVMSLTGLFVFKNYCLEFDLDDEDEVRRNKRRWVLGMLWSLVFYSLIMFRFAKGIL